MSDEDRNDPEGSGKSEQPTLEQLREDWEQRKAADTAGADSTQENLSDLEYATDKAVAQAKGDLDIPDTFVRRELMGRAAEDPDFDAAWRNRNTDRAAWDAKLGEINEEWKVLFNVKEDDGDAGDDDAGAKAAVRRARTSDTPDLSGFDNVNWATLSDADFEQKKQEVFAAAKAGSLS